MKKVFFPVFFVLIIVEIIQAQEETGNDIRLAYEYYRTKDYDKAEILFEKIFASTGAKVYFTGYSNCLIEQAKYEQAEKEIKKQIKIFKDDPTYLVDLGYLYKRQTDFQKSEMYYNEALEKPLNTASSFRSLAFAFMQREEYDYAEKVFLKGRRTVQDNFRSDLANLYSVERKYDKMINEYLDWLEESPTNINAVQERMQFFINNDIENEFSEIIKRELIKRIQKPDSPIAFNKMLIWYHMQRMEFDKALVQEIAIDKRLNTTGKGVLDLAETAKTGMDYETALNAYNYVIDKGKNKPYYLAAETGQLNVYYLQVINGLINTEEEIKALEEKYLSSINTTGIGPNTVQSVIDLGHLQAFYLNTPDKAEKLLIEAMNLTGLEVRLASLCKIELGDVLVYTHDLDYAALIYGQVEKDNKDNQIGDNAKLKKAKLAYYSCQFEWAKAQFDALKESTSKLVANDALYYSVLIDENSEGDSLQLAICEYAKAELDIFRHQYKDASITLDSLIKQFPTHQIIDDTYMLKAQIYETMKDYTSAETYYKKVYTEFAYDITADLALLKLALLYEEKLNNKEEAAEYYKKLMIEYPESIYISEARRRFRALRENMI